MAIYKLKDIAHIKRGSSPRPIGEWLEKNGLPWAKISDLDKNSLSCTKQFVREEWVEKGLIGNYNDLFITNSATPGVPFIQKSINKIAYHDGFLGITPNKEKVLKKYLLYKLIIDRPKLIKMGNGAVFVNLSSEILKNWKVELPSLSEQQKIIDIIEPLERFKKNINYIMNSVLFLIKNLPHKKITLSLKECVKVKKEKPRGIRQLSAKMMNKRTPLIKKFEKQGTYKTNSFYAKKNSLLINTIRPNLEKFALLPLQADVNGTSIILEVLNHKTSVLSALLNNDSWSYMNKNAKGTKMPVISKNDILNLKIYCVDEVENIFNLISTMNYILLKADIIKSNLIKILIK